MTRFEIPSLHFSSPPLDRLFLVLLDDDEAAAVAAKLLSVEVVAIRSKQNVVVAIAAAVTQCENLRMRIEAKIDGVS